MKKLLGFVISLMITVSAFGANWYVSQTTGKKKAPGTINAPFKALADAIKNAAPGDVIFVAEGSYTGAMGASEIIIDKPLTIMGGYSTDFSQRDYIRHPTLIQPKNEKNDTKGQSVIMLKLPQGYGPAMIIDGLVIDQGFMNSYHAVKGKPPKLETGYWLEPPEFGADDTFASANCNCIYMETQNRYTGDIVIQNCIFANSGNIAISIARYAGVVKIINNVFVGNRLEACEVSCSSNPQMPSNPMVQVEFAYNTVLLTWSRTFELSDMGYGFRCLTMVQSNIHNNFFGFNIYAGIGNDKGQEKLPGVNRLVKDITINNNAFLLNMISDVTITKSPSIMKLFVDDEAFEDLSEHPGIRDIDGNVTFPNPASLKGVLNLDYLSAFLNFSFTSRKDLKANSPVNTFRAAIGLPAMTQRADVFMYANRYPLEDCYKLFGANPTYGAQILK